MNDVFISHSHADMDFAGLLVKLLRAHNINAWLSEVHQDIASAITLADFLVVLVSKDAKLSKWVHSEISAFRTAKPQGRIIPIRLDATEPNAVFEGLSKLQYIDFSASTLKGFDDLLVTLGKQFLRSETGRLNERRGASGSAERRSGKDRRKSPLKVRLRKGFWYSFYRATELEKQERFVLDLYNLERVVDGVLAEAQKYRCVEKESGILRSPHQALTDSASRVWERSRDWDLRTINVVEAVAEQFNQDYELTAIDRRLLSERRLTLLGKVAVG